MPAAKTPSSEGSRKPRGGGESNSQGDVPNWAKSATQLARRVQPVDRLVRGADRVRRTVVGGAGSEFPIADYAELTVAQVQVHLPGLAPAQLRKVRDYERSHANRKSVLAAVEKLLG